MLLSGFAGVFGFLRVLRRISFFSRLCRFYCAHGGNRKSRGARKGRAASLRRHIAAAPRGAQKAPEKREGPGRPGLRKRMEFLLLLIAAAGGGK